MVAGEQFEPGNPNRANDRVAPTGVGLVPCTHKVETGFVLGCESLLNPPFLNAPWAIFWGTLNGSVPPSFGASALSTLRFRVTSEILDLGGFQNLRGLGAQRPATLELNADKALGGGSPRLWLDSITYVYTVGLDAGTR